MLRFKRLTALLGASPHAHFLTSRLTSPWGKPSGRGSHSVKLTPPTNRSERGSIPFSPDQVFIFTTAYCNLRRSGPETTLLSCSQIWPPETVWANQCLLFQTARFVHYTQQIPIYHPFLIWSTPDFFCLEDYSFLTVVPVKASASVIFILWHGCEIFEMQVYLVFLHCLKNFSSSLLLLEHSKLHTML